MGKPKKTIHLAKQLEIKQQLQALAKRRIKFSFQYLQETHSKFPLHGCTIEFLAHLLSTMKEYSTLTVEEFSTRDEEHHRHQIDFSVTTEPDGFGVDPIDVGSDEPYQFGLCDESLGSDGGWRIHGFLRGDVFHVVWLDFHALVLDGGRSRPRPKKRKK